MRIRTLLALTAMTVAASACAQRTIHEEPIVRNGDRVASADAAVERARADARAEQYATRARHDSLQAAALASCAPAVCEAIARGEMAIGMSEPQVLAATRTTEGAWSIRDAAGATVMVPASLTTAPRDGVGELAMVQLRNGRVSSYSYQESQGVRLVASAEDATTEGRARAMADALLREGDDYAARGEFDAALNRYDRAHILAPEDPMTTYRIATALDKQLRPIEARIQYQLFLHRLELEKIDAVGDQYAKLADAIAQARQRILIIEREGR